MRIAYLNFEKGWRGGERQTLLMAHGMAERGHQVSVLVRAGEPLSHRLDSGKVRIIAARNRWHLLYCLFRYRKYFDVWHAQTANTLTLLSLMQPLLQGIIAFTRRTDFPVNKKKKGFSWLKDWRVRAKWKRINAFVAISHAAAAEPLRLGFKPALIPSAVPFVECNPQRLQVIEAQLPANAFVLGTTAVLKKEKDPWTLIHAVEKLSKKHPNIVFLHFGGEGNASEEARLEVKRLGIEQNYRFMGFNAHIEDVYRLFDVFVLSSRMEALGSSILDAFIYQVPTVATNAGGIPSLVTAERGWLCPVGDAQAIADACEEILTHPELAQEKVQTAHRWVRQEHGVEQMLDRYEQFYTQHVS